VPRTLLALTALAGLVVATLALLLAPDAAGRATPEAPATTSYDDRALTPTGIWRRLRVHGATVSRSRSPGATLTASTPTQGGGRLGVQVGPGRGVLAVLVGGRRVSTVATDASRVRWRHVSFTGDGTVTLRVLRPGRRGVYVDALDLHPPAPTTPSASPTPSPSQTDPPLPNGVRITELMPDPVETTDADGEWVELTNVASADADLRGCTLTTQSGSAGTLGALTVAGAGRVVLAHVLDEQRNGGVGASARFAPSLVNADGSLDLSCRGTPIDRVTWGATTPGAARQRDDDGRWCDATERYHGTDRGSPGRANPTCRGSGLGVQGLRSAGVLGEQLDPAAQAAEQVAGGEAGLHRGHGQLDLVVVEGAPDDAAGDDLEHPLLGVDHHEHAARGRDQRVVQLRGERAGLTLDAPDEHGELHPRRALGAAHGLVERRRLGGSEPRGQPRAGVTSGHSRHRPSIRASPGRGARWCRSRGRRATGSRPARGPARAARRAPPTGGRPGPRSG
jgi:hypothetical protein